MVDTLTAQQRSYNMSRIRSRDTKPELLVREAFKRLRLRYHPKMEGSPDFASKKHRIAVFIDGCFWHGCKKCYREPETNRKFWREKIRRNRKRDAEVTSRLVSGGWDVVRIWEHELGKGNDIRKRIMRKIGP